MCFFSIFLKLVLVVFNLLKTERTSFPLYTPLFDWKYVNNWYILEVLLVLDIIIYFIYFIYIVLVYSETSIYKRTPN